jgi:hypothetical protein
MIEEVSIHCYCGRTITFEYDRKEHKGAVCECGERYNPDVIDAFVFAQRAKYKMVLENGKEYI